MSAFGSRLDVHNKSTTLSNPAITISVTLPRIRKHLSLHATIALANALVCSRLDYCNSLLHSANVTYLDNLQSVQNSLARVVTKSPRLTPSNPLPH